MYYSCLSCFLAVVFLVSMIYTNIQCKKHSIIQEFENTLSSSEKQKYDFIVKERLSIYNRGFLIGIISTLILIWGSTLFTRSGIVCDKTICSFIHKLTKMNKLCVGVVTTFMVTYSYYLLSKKSDYIVLHLDDKKKREKWLDVYKYMQRQNHLGFLYGLIGSAFLSIMF